MASIEDLVRQRDTIVAEADAARQAGLRDLASSEALQATRDAVGDLERIADALQSAGAGGVERCRTLRQVARLKADLAAASDSEALLEAEWLLREAGRALEGYDDATESALLDYRLGEVMWKIDHADVSHLREAQERVHRARNHFAAHGLPELAQCDSVLSSIGEALASAREAGVVPMGGGDASAFDGPVAIDVDARLDALRQSGGGLDGMLAQAMQDALALTTEGATDSHAPELAGTPSASPTAASPASNTTAREAELVAALDARLQREIDSGMHTPERIDSLSDKVQFIKKSLRKGESSLAGLFAMKIAHHEFFNETLDSDHYPSYGLPRPAQGTRAAALVEMNWLLRRRLMQAMNQAWNSDHESREAMDLFGRAGEVDKRIYEAGANDAAAAAVEGEHLRPLAAAVRVSTGRSHMMLAQPLWGAGELAAGTQTLFFAGPPGSEELLSLACRRSGLQLPPPGAGEAHARMRWRQLQRAAVAVFDLRAGTDCERADTSYELGMALTLGKSIVVLADPARLLPFDIAIDPVELGAAANSEVALADAVDRAVCWAYPETAGKPWHATLDAVIATYPKETGNVGVDQTVNLLRGGEARSDPVVAHGALDSLLKFKADGRTRVVHPHWAPAYPAAGGGQRVFHVTPFRPAWAEEVTELVRAACRQQGAKYVRGDEVSQPDVVESIWTEIARATHVLGDLTGLNANVALELGIAHTLGKPVLIIGQGRTVDELFPMLSRMRLQPYEVGARLPVLATVVDNFLAP